MIGALSQFGKVGMLAIGTSADDAERLYQRAVAVLDEETRYRTRSLLPATIPGPSSRTGRAH